MAVEDQENDNSYKPIDSHGDNVAASKVQYKGAGKVLVHPWAGRQNDLKVELLSHNRLRRGAAADINPSPPWPPQSRNAMPPPETDDAPPHQHRNANPAPAPRNAAQRKRMIANASITPITQPLQNTGLLEHIMETTKRQQHHVLLPPHAMQAKGVQQKNGIVRPAVFRHKYGQPLAPDIILQLPEADPVSLTNDPVLHQDINITEQTLLRHHSEDVTLPRERGLQLKDNNTLANSNELVQVCLGILNAIPEEGRLQQTNAIAPQLQHKNLQTGNDKGLANAEVMQQQWLGIHNAIAKNGRLQQSKATSPRPGNDNEHGDVDGLQHKWLGIHNANAAQKWLTCQNATAQLGARTVLPPANVHGLLHLLDASTARQAGGGFQSKDNNEVSVQHLNTQPAAGGDLRLENDNRLANEHDLYQQWLGFHNAVAQQPRDTGVHGQVDNEPAVAITPASQHMQLHAEKVTPSTFLESDAMMLLHQYNATATTAELKQALQRLPLRHKAAIADNGLQRQLQQPRWRNNGCTSRNDLREQVHTLLLNHPQDKLLPLDDLHQSAKQVLHAQGAEIPEHLGTQDQQLQAICRALHNVGLDSTAFKKASLNPQLLDEDLLALPDMPWDWNDISCSKNSLKESTLLTLRDKPWYYRFLSHLPWSDDIISELSDKDWNYELLGNKTMRSAELLMKTSTKAWDWLGQLGQLVEHAQHKVTVKQLLLKALLTSDEVVWDWHKPFNNSKLANALLSIALTEIPKHPNEPWDYAKLSAAWWYPIDALLSLGVDKPWNMDVVSAREDLTADHVFKLYPHVAWNMKITNKNPNIMAATQRCQEVLKARDIILKAASSAPHGRLYLLKLRLSQRQQHGSNGEAAQNTTGMV